MTVPPLMMTSNSCCCAPRADARIAAAARPHANNRIMDSPMASRRRRAVVACARTVVVLTLTLRNCRAGVKAALQSGVESARDRSRLSRADPLPVQVDDRCDVGRRAGNEQLIEREKLVNRERLFSHGNSLLARDLD